MEPPYDPNSSVLEMARTYATFLTTTLTPKLEALVKARDDLNGKLDSLELLRLDMEKFEEVRGRSEC